MSAQTNRLFIAEYENSKEWTDGKRVILSKIQEGDFYLIFKTGKGKKLSPLMVGLINDIGDKKQIIDVTQLNDQEYKKRITKEIKKYADTNTDVYFLYMDPVFQQLKTKILGINSVQSRRNYKVGRNVTKKNVIESNEDTYVGTPVDSIDIMEENSTVFNSMANMLADDNIRINEEELKGVNENSQEILDLNTLEPLKVSPQKNNKQDTKSKKPNGPPLGQKKGKTQKKQNSEPNAAEGLTVNDLEKIIFENRLTSSEFKLEYTELDDAKAHLVKLLYERLIESIDKLVKNIKSYKFEQHQYLKFVTTIIKANDYEDFKESWEVAEPGKALKIDQTIYTYLHDESQYYAKVCTMLYDEDEWS